MTPSFLWILFSTPFFCSTVSLDTFAGGLHGVIDVEEESAQAQARRAAKGSAALMDMFLKDKGKSVKHAGPDEETFYQPYWDGGHWVFFRPPTTTVVTREGQYIRPTTTKMYDPKKPTKTPAVVTSHHCNRACLQIYKDYGTVCGRLFRIKYSSEYWDYLYRTFDNICALENYSCNDENKILAYQLIYKGPCRQKEASWQESTDTMANGPLIVPQGGYGVMDVIIIIMERNLIYPRSLHTYRDGDCIANIFLKPE